MGIFPVTRTRTRQPTGQRSTGQRVPVGARSGARNVIRSRGLLRSHLTGLVLTPFYTSDHHLLPRPLLIVIADLNYSVHMPGSNNACLP